MDFYKDKVIIIAGCGGGYDIFGGLITYYRLKNIAKKIIMINYSFTSIDLLKSTAECINSHLYKVSPKTNISDDKLYYPEARLSSQLDIPIYTLSNDPTVYDITECYNTLINKEGKIDIIYLVDGGCDVLLTGDEVGLATPVEDMMHLKAILSINISYKYIITLGVNIDTAHGVIQSDLDNRLDYLEKSSSMISSEYLNLLDPSVTFYYQIVKKCNPISSIVHSLVISTLEGNRGFYTPDYLKERIKESIVSLTDQTCTLYQFDLIKIAYEVKYLNQIEINMNTDDVDNLIEKYQKNK